MSTPNRELQAAFERYFEMRIQKEKAITPGQKKELIEKLRQELSSQGRVPLPTGPVKVDAKHAAIRAALEGRVVTMGGKVITQKSGDISSRMEALPVAAKMAVMVAIFLIPLLLIGLIMFARGGDSEEVALLAPTATPTSIQTATATPSPSATLEPSAIPPTATPAPSMTAVIIEISPTPYAFALTSV